MKTILIVMLCSVVITGTAFAFDAAPRLTDREIVESLTELKQGQKAMEQRFVALEKRLDTMIYNFDKRFEASDKRFDEMVRNFDKRFDEMIRNSDKRFEAVDQRFEDMNQRFEDMQNTIMTFYTTSIGLIAALFGYMIWDRKKSNEPLKKMLEGMSTDLDGVKTELDLDNPSGPVVRRLVEVLKKLSQTDERLAHVLRSFSLL